MYVHARSFFRQRGSAYARLANGPVGSSRIVIIADDLIGTQLGRRICLGLGFFWSVRALVQWFVYSPELWRGRRFETAVHVVFSLLWVYCAVVFLSAGA